jgi:hypothetical protein
MAGAIAGLAQGEAAQLVPTQYSQAQLASLLSPYHHRWNGAAYFVIIFSGLIVLGAVLFGLDIFVGKLYRRSSIGEGESYLLGKEKRSKRAVPSTRVINALKAKEISHPMPSEDGLSDGYDTKSHESGHGSRDVDDEVTHGW